MYVPTEVVGSFRNFTTDEDDLLDGFIAASSTEAWRTAGSISPSRHINGHGRKVSVGLIIPNIYDIPPYDFDVRSVRVRVGYQVLQ